MGIMNPIPEHGARAAVKEVTHLCVANSLEDLAGVLPILLLLRNSLLTEADLEQWRPKDTEAKSTKAV